MNFVQKIRTSLEGKFMGIEKLHIGLLGIFLLCIIMSKTENFVNKRKKRRNKR
jgi:hypothetical protein